MVHNFKRKLCTLTVVENGKPGRLKKRFPAAFIFLQFSCHNHKPNLLIASPVIFWMRLVVLLAVLSTILLFQPLVSSAEKTNKIIVKLKPHVSVEEVTATHPGVKFERASSIPRVFVFSVQNIESVDQETAEFASDMRVLWSHVDEIRPEESDVIPIPTDPSFKSGEQWFHGHINSSYAWSKGLSGQGQIIQVIDSPVFPSELDLMNQIDVARSFEGNVANPPTSAIPHGTVCSNIIVAESNDFCGVGVAFSSRVAVFSFILNRPGAFSDIQFAEAYAAGFPVSSNSYGSPQCFRGCSIDRRGIAPVIRDALELAQERNNTVFVFTAGNEGLSQGSPNFRAFGSTPRVIIVGATRYNGTRASYSNVGPANWIVAPAGDHDEKQIWTSSIVNNTQQCGEAGVGTSYSAPMVSGAAAILRSAYPSLTWRDAKLILAYSADRTDIEHSSWIKNGAGRWFSNHYGFGQLNVGKAVELGSTWKSVGPLQIRTFHSNINTPLLITKDDSVVTASISVPYGLVSRVESVQLTLNMDITTRGDVKIELISPSGTPCVIFPFRNDLGWHYRDYITSANCFLDEDPAGQWTLKAERERNSSLWSDPLLNSFAVTVWGETAPSQVQLLASSTAPRLSSFTIKEGDTFQQLTLFNNYPATIGLFWKDAFGLYGELFTRSGLQTTGTQRLNPSNSDHPTVSVFSGGDHVLTYLTTINQTSTMFAEVRNIDFIPLTPLIELPFDDINPEYLSVAVIESSVIVSYRSLNNSTANLVLLSVDFGSRDVVPLCVPRSNVTTDADGDLMGVDNNCTEIIYRRDGDISFTKLIELRTQSEVALQPIGMNLVLGTWSDGQSITAALITSDLEMRAIRLQAPPTSIVRAAATPEDVFIAFGHQQGVLLERYDTDLVLHESFVVPTNEPVVAISLTYTHIEGLSLIVATSHNISLTTFLRSYDRSFVQTNQATIASMLSLNVPVLDIDQSVMSNGDLAVTFSTIQEIHVQLFDSTVFGTAPLLPDTPIAQPIVFVSSPENNTPSTELIVPSNETYQEEESQMPSWVIALIVIGSLLALLFAVILILAYRMGQRTRRVVFQQDPDLIAYTKMSI